MERVINERRIEPEESERSHVYCYSVLAESSVQKLWVDAFGQCWLEAKDGAQVCVPKDLRHLVAKRVREAQP